MAAIEVDPTIPAPSLPLPPSASSETTYFNGTSYLLEWNNKAGQDTNVPLSGEITGPIFQELAKWKRDNIQLSSGLST